MQKLAIILAISITQLLSTQSNNEKSMKKDLELFANFKPESSFHPNWEKEQDEQILVDCN